MAVLIAALGVLVGGRPVAAHTALERSTPAAAEVVAVPVSEITLDFTAAVNTVQDGYEVLDPQGQVRRPDAIEQPVRAQARAAADGRSGGASPSGA